MQKEGVSYAKTVVNASYVSRRGSGTCAVRQVPPSRFQRDEASSLKVKQHLIQLAREERDGARRDERARHPKLDRSASLDYGRLSSRIFEYKIDSNRMAEKAFDNSRGYPIEADVIKPLALKPLVLSNSEVSLSQALSSELFSSGSIPSNKEIDRLLEVIKAVRQRNCSGDETSGCHGNRVRFRRHSDVSDLRNSKRSIKDPPSRSIKDPPSSRSLTRSKSNGTSDHKEAQNFGSSRSAFKSIPRSSSGKHLHKRQCSQEPIPEEEEVLESIKTSPKVQKPELGKPERLYPVLSPLEDHMPPKPSVPKPSKVDVPEKRGVSSEDPSPTQSEPSDPPTPPDNSLRTTPSPDNENCAAPSLDNENCAAPSPDNENCAAPNCAAPPPKPAVNSRTYVTRRSASSPSLGFSVRNPTSRTPQDSSRTPQSSSRNEPRDIPDKFSLQDIQEILDSFDVIQQTAPSSDKEYHKVHNMLQSKLTIALGSIYHTLSTATVPPNSAQYFAKNTLEDTLDYLDERLDVEEDNANILELVGLLETFEDFIDLHDEIISRRYYENETLPEMKEVKSVGGNDTTSNTNHSIYRMVGLHKNRGEPLGITLKKEDDRVVVHRILAGGMIDRQRLLHIGDVIISINNQDVQPKPETIQHMLKDQEGDIHLKIIPSYREQAPACQVFVKAHFNYDPRTDNLIPCKEAGLKFNEGDILQIVNQDDPNWWQAKMEGGEGQAGLIPGLILQEQRMASKNNANNEKSTSIGCGGANRRKKKNKKMNYSANKNSDFDQHELNLYEEVAKMPPFDRKTLVLIGAQGVGRRSLISKLVLNEPDKFGNTMPHTSRPIRAGEKDGCGYWFTSREKMDEDIANHKYLEYGEYEKHLYGTKLDSIRQVMRSGKMCLLDVNPQSLKVLKTSEFVPYIVFIEAPPFETLVQMHRESARDNPNKAFSETDLKKSIEESKRLKRQYSHYFDVIIQNNNMDETYSKLYECISKLSTSPQWVPVNWFY